MVTYVKTRNCVPDLIIALIIILGSYGAWTMTGYNLDETISQGEILGPRYMGDISGFHQFLVSYKFTNNGLLTIRVTNLTAKLLLNDVDYHSTQMTFNNATVEPKKTVEIPLVFNLRNVPIGLQPNQLWNVTTISKITGESGFSLLKYMKTVERVDSIDWIANLTNNP